EKNVRQIAEIEVRAGAGRARLEHVADRITKFCANVHFVYVHTIFFAAWLALNYWSVLHFDPFPFELLNMFVALETIFITPFILIAQRHQEALSKRRNHLDLQINLLAEQETSKILSMLEKLMEYHNIAL